MLRGAVGWGPSAPPEAACVPHQDTHERLRRDAEAADRAGLAFGVKLVRGAYLDKEREVARLQGTQDPTQPDYEATNQR